MCTKFKVKNSFDLRFMNYQIPGLIATVWNLYFMDLVYFMVSGYKA